MMKIGWSLYTKKDDLWILVIRSKYKCENDIVPLMNSKRSDSNLRRGNYSSRENVQNNLAWNIGDGTSVDFWKHEWVPFRGKLLGIASCPIPVGRVSNKEFKSWLFENFTSNLMVNGKNWSSRKAAVGGALSGHIGSVLFSFVVDIGYCSVLAVKLWAIFLGLQLDKSHVFKEFIVESDSKSTIELIKECPDTHPCFMLIKNINEFELKGGVFVWSHMLQEGNPIVDKLVGFGLSVDASRLANYMLDWLHLLHSGLAHPEGKDNVLERCRK
ncbi:hypothetical protein JHK84_052477 [Glycine max]|nr:hypothetical protein JHK86_052437 [Glycine max]KAG5082439.1 hypothetical protein JHK84_052477 [Glycine max]